VQALWQSQLNYPTLNPTLGFEGIGFMAFTTNGTSGGSTYSVSGAALAHAGANVNVPVACVTEYNSHASCP